MSHFFNPCWKNQLADRGITCYSAILRSTDRLTSFWLYSLEVQTWAWYQFSHHTLGTFFKKFKHQDVTWDESSKKSKNLNVLTVRTSVHRHTHRVRCASWSLVPAGARCWCRAGISLQCSSVPAHHIHPPRTEPPHSLPLRPPGEPLTWGKHRTSD